MKITLLSLVIVLSLVSPVFSDAPAHQISSVSGSNFDPMSECLSVETKSYCRTLGIAQNFVFLTQNDENEDVFSSYRQEIAQRDYERFNKVQYSSSYTLNIVYTTSSGTEITSDSAQLMIRTGL